VESLLGVFNGEFLPVNDIKISPMSRAYTFSDAVYEVVPYIQGRAIAFDQHLNRLSRSCKAIQLNVDISIVEKEIQELAHQVLMNANGYIYYQLSRGIDAIRKHHYANDLTPESFGYVALTSQHNGHQIAKIVSDIRWGRCDIKSTALLANVMLMNQASSEGCNEIIMHRDGYITEAGSSNIFIVKDTKILTPPKDSHILAGITRELLLENFSQSFNILEEPCHLEILTEADVVFLTSSTKGMLAIDEIQNNAYSFNQNNDLFTMLKAAFNNFLETAF
jgi:D-alanine transaminase